MNSRRVLTLAVAVGLAALPLFIAGQRYVIRLVILGLHYVSLASAWNLVGGFIGQISFGHSALFGLGAYTTALLWLRETPPLLTMPLAGAAAAAYAALWGWPCLRLRGPYFAIATIGVGEATRIFMNNLEASGGSSGLALPSPARYSEMPHYYLALGLAVLTLGVAHLVSRSTFGLGLAALRQDIDAAESLGVPTARYQLYALVISGFLVGLGGSFYAQLMYYVVPEKVFGFDLSIAMILMSVIGGVGTLFGPAVGAVLFLLLEQFVLISFPHLHLGTFGLLLVGIVLYEPRGLSGIAARLRSARLPRSSHAAP